MLESARQSIGMRVARFRFRNSQDKIISFTRSIPAAETLLVIVPFRSADATASMKCLAVLGHHFDEENITVVTGGQRATVERVLPRSRIVALETTDITKLFLPRGLVIDRICERTYDLAVDLNLDFMLPSSYICRASNARVRVGFSSPRADAFYNFQLRLDPASDRGHAYERLVKCLQMFFVQEDV